MKASDFDLQLETIYKSSVERLICSESFDLKEYENLLHYIRRKASLIKNEVVVSKQVISYLIQASESIRNRADFLSSAKENLNLANEFDLLLSYIAMGIDPEERRPGVPRIF